MKGKLLYFETQAVVEETREARKRSERAARAYQQEADLARQQAQNADTAAKRKGAVRREKKAQRKAEAANTEGKRKARDVGRKVSAELKAGKRGYRQVAAAGPGRQSLNLGPDLEHFINKLTHELNSILNTALRPDSRVDQLQALIWCREHLTDSQRQNLREVLSRLADRANKYAGRFAKQEAREPEAVHSQTEEHVA